MGKVLEGMLSFKGIVTVHPLCNLHRRPSYLYNIPLVFLFPFREGILSIIPACFHLMISR